MASKKNAHARSVARMATELGVAAPLVVAQRLSRLRAGDGSELVGMVVEKQLAFTKSWLAMVDVGIRLQQQMMTSWLGSFPPALGSPQARLRREVNRGTAAALRIVDAGLRPVHRKAVSNSKRLSKAKPR